MLQSKTRIKQITVDDKTETVVIRGGVRVEFNSNGSVAVYSDVPVTLHPAINDATEPASKSIEVGDQMEDGTIFAGVSPDTGKNMFVMPESASGIFNWYAAKRYIDGLDAHGHKDWQFPSESELNILFKNHAKLEGFSGDWHWSSALGQFPQSLTKFYARVRPVRLEAV